MTPLDQMRAWIATFPGFDFLANGFHVDYTDQIPANNGVLPSGLVEIERKRDILGRTSALNQYHFGLYRALGSAYALGTTPGVDRVPEFRAWVQEQSVRGLTPRFGDEPGQEKMTAQDGALYNTNEGAAIYLVRLSAQHKKNYEVNNNG